MKKLLRYTLGTEGNNVQLWQMVRPSDAIVEIMDTEWLECVGENRDYFQSNLQVLELIAREIALQYPDRPDKRISILDGGSQTGTCINHETHSGAVGCLDIQYYTHGANNHTQWPGPVTEIWTGGELNENFDVERNTLLVKLLYDCFSDVGRSQWILMHSKIKAALVSKANEWWPDKARGPFKSPGEWRQVQAAIQDHNSLNHDLHMHTVMKQINFDAQI
jgi:hypothetical protein